MADQHPEYHAADSDRESRTPAHDNNGSPHPSDNGNSSKRTRGGTREQHIQAGVKGGARIRQLIAQGYLYEQEHGIGPGRNRRSRVEVAGSEDGAATERDGDEAE